MRPAIAPGPGDDAGDQDADGQRDLRGEIVEHEKLGHQQASVSAIGRMAIASDGLGTSSTMACPFQGNPGAGGRACDRALVMIIVATVTFGQGFPPRVRAVRDRETPRKRRPQIVSPGKIS